MAFNNMMQIVPNAELAEQIVKLAESALSNEKVEVRTKAEEVLAGFIHSQFVGKEKTKKLLVSCHSQIH